MNLWDSRPKTEIVYELSTTPELRYRRAAWETFTDRRDWRIGVRLHREYGNVDINLPMVQFVREGWYGRKHG